MYIGGKEIPTKGTASAQALWESGQVLEELLGSQGDWSK